MDSGDGTECGTRGCRRQLHSTFTSVGYVTAAINPLRNRRKVFSRKKKRVVFSRETLPSIKHKGYINDVFFAIARSRQCRFKLKHTQVSFLLIMMTFVAREPLSIRICITISTFVPFFFRLSPQNNFLQELWM